MLIAESMQRLTLVGCLVSLLACDGKIEAPFANLTPDPNGTGAGVGTGGSGSGTGGGSQTVDMPCVPGTGADPMPMRRLTRAQYDNAARDLLGSTQSHADKLPVDEKTGLFLSNVSGSVSWNMLEQYGITAEELTTDVARLRSAVDACDVQATGEATCADRFIAQFGHRAFRRPLTAPERDRYRALYDAHRASTGHDDGIRFVARTMLQSPNFLYHFQEDLAAKLAFFIWNSVPDRELLAADLSTRAGVEAQITRLLADDRAKSALATFHLQLLGVDAAHVPNKSPTVYPGFDAARWRAMVDDTSRFADDTVRKGDGKLTTLLTASYSVNPGDVRAGLLTQPAVLAGLANPDTTSPVRRGVMIRRNLMCQTLPDPPPDAPTMVPPAMGQETTRMRVTRVTSQSARCGSCHGFINDVGFGFENYDAVGAWQTMDNGLPIDATGQLTGTKASNGPFDGARELATRLAGSREVQECYTKQWVRFALGRIEQPRDNCEVQDLAKALGETSDIRALIRSIAVSRAFAPEGIVPDPGGGTAGGSGGTAGGSGSGGGMGGTAGGGMTQTTTVLLASGAQLNGDQSVTTSDGTHRLVYQLDGNLVLYRSNGMPTWSSVTAGTTVGVTAMQGDGNLVVYDQGGAPRFNTGTHGNPGAQLHFEPSTGRIHVITVTGTRLWSAP